MHQPARRSPNLLQQRIAIHTLDLAQDKALPAGAKVAIAQHGTVLAASIALATCLGAVRAPEPAVRGDFSRDPAALPVAGEVAGGEKAGPDGVGEHAFAGAEEVEVDVHPAHGSRWVDEVE